MRYSTRLVVFLFFLNAAAGLLVASGWAGDAGIQPQPGGDTAIEQANSSAAAVQASGGLGQTLYGLFISVSGTFRSIIGAVTAGPVMLANLGVPGWLVGFVFAPMYLFIGIDMMFMLTGRRA